MDLSKINKKLFKYLIIIGIVFVVFIIIMFIFKGLSGGKLSYNQIENKMVSAAKNYVKDEETGVSLPEGNEVITIEVSDLVANKNMDELSKYVKNSKISCDGNVVIKKYNDEYVYTPYLDCGEAYKTMNLSDYIISKGTVEESDGLYYINNEYVYRGEYVDNYVKFADQLWQIIKIDSNGNIKLVQVNSKVRNNWDDRYNVDFSSTVGINNFELSRIHDALDELYETVLTDDDKKYVATKSLCVGKRYQDDTTKNGVTECSVVLEGQKVGLIQANEFLMASLDSNCYKIGDGACQNYNYLSDLSGSWWTITPNAAKTSKVYGISGGNVFSSNASSSKIIRMVLYLNSDVVYDSGDGTSENPYIFK